MRQEFRAAWGHMDFNGHMANRAYLDIAVDSRLLYFASHGFAPATLAKIRLGPVVMKDEIEYFRELNLHEIFSATLSLAGLAENGSRMRLRNEFYKSDGRLAARLTTTGGWLDLDQRRLRLPPAELLACLQALDRTEDFEVLPSSLK